MSYITVVIENPSNEELADFSARMLAGNVVALGIGNEMWRADIAEEALRELEHEPVAFEALTKLDDVCHELAE